MLANSFFQQDACVVARKLLGKIIRHYYQHTWLAARIIETEAYYLEEKGSHSSLGFTEKRKAMFMPPGTIYMYYARGGDSLNISVKGEGNAVLIKSAFPWFDQRSPKSNLSIMQQLNPIKSNKPPSAQSPSRPRIRPAEKLCAGQTLLCRALGLKVSDWDQQHFDPARFYIEDIGYKVKQVIQTRRLGIPASRDAHLPYRFIDYDFSPYTTSNPLTKRGFIEGEDYQLI